MRFAVIYRPKFPIPPAELPEMLKGMGDWVQRYGDRVEGTQFFVGGGGFGLVDSDDAEELTRLLAENPFTPYSEVEVKPLLDPAAALSILAEAYS
jgi:hypothetical protein